MREGGDVAGGLATRVPTPAKAAYESLRPLLGQSSAGLRRILSDSWGSWRLTLRDRSGCPARFLRFPSERRSGEGPGPLPSTTACSTPAPAEVRRPWRRTLTSAHGPTPS